MSSIVEDVRGLGYSKLILKSDNEPAIVKLLSEALRALRIEGAASAPVLMQEHSPEYDHGRVRRGGSEAPLSAFPDIDVQLGVGD